MSWFRRGVHINSLLKNITKVNSTPSVRVICSNGYPNFYSNQHALGTNKTKNVGKTPSRFSSTDFEHGLGKNQVKTLAASLVDNSSLKIQPYLKLMRIDKPTGSWLLFWPCGWSIAMAADAGCLPDMKMLMLFGAGALIMRGAGCTINDMWDKDIDSKVERTKDRPLVNGMLTQTDAWCFLAAQLSVALMILLQLNWYSVFLGASSLGLVIVYPLMKRVTYWPQLILGMTFNWGALLGWSALHSTVNWSVCVPLYLSGVCWTIVYDTIYAHQDKRDDVVLGIKSTALKFGDNTKLWLSAFSSGMIGGLLSCGMLSEQTWPFFTSVGIISVHLAHQLYTLNINNPIDCGNKFISNQNIGLLLFLGIIASTLLKTKHKSSSEIAEASLEPQVLTQKC